MQAEILLWSHHCPELLLINTWSQYRGITQLSTRSTLGSTGVLDDGGPQRKAAGFPCEHEKVKNALLLTYLRVKIEFFRFNLNFFRFMICITPKIP